jgi:hypothetical protein
MTGSIWVSPLDNLCAPYIRSESRSLITVSVKDHKRKQERISMKNVWAEELSIWHFPQCTSFVYAMIQELEEPVLGLINTGLLKFK